MVFVMALAFAFTAKADAADVHFGADDLAAGDFVIAVKDNGSFKALSATETTIGSKKAFAGTDITVEDDCIVTNPADAIVWTATADTTGGREGFKLTNKSTSKDLYFSTEGLKYQSQGYRPVAQDQVFLYVKSTDGNNPDTYMYVAYDGAFTTSYDKDQDTAKDGASGLVLFKKMTDAEYEEYEQGKAAAELQAEKINAKNKINGTDCDQAIKDEFIKQVEAAADKAAVTKALEDFEKAVADAAAEKAVADAVKAATDKINATTCDQKIKDKYLEELKGAKSESAVADILKNFEDEVKKSGGDPETAKEEQKKATDEINKVAADTSKYDADEQKAIKDLANQYIIKINATTNVNEIKNLVNAFNAEIKALPTKADKAAIAKIQIKMKKIKVGKKKMTVKWTPKKANFDGYEISYQIKGKKKAKKVTVKKATASKKVIKKLKKGKKYKVKVRGYKLFGTKKDIKVYGKWSKTKTSKKIK